MSVEMRATTRFEEDDIALIETSPVGRDDSHVVGVVILVHGLGGQKSSESHLAAIQMLSDRGFATIRFDFPGHGESGGTTEALTIAKGARLIDHITNIAASRYVGQPISLLGASFGATCILASSAVERATAIVLRSPVSDYQGVRLRQLGLEGLARWEREGLIDGLISGNRRSPWAFYLEAGQINLFASATERYARMLIVQGQEDDTVPISDSLRLSKAWAGRSDVVVIKGGDHSLTDLVHMGIYIALACHWIASQGAQSRGWAAAGSIDTDLSFLNLLELYGTEIAESFTEGLMPSTVEYPVLMVKRSLVWSIAERRLAILATAQTDVPE